jgi:hypothetical protein
MVPGLAPFPTQMRAVLVGLLNLSPWRPGAGRYDDCRKGTAELANEYVGKKEVEMESCGRKERLFATADLGIPDPDHMLTCSPLIAGLQSVAYTGVAFACASIGAILCTSASRIQIFLISSMLTSFVPILDLEPW